MSLKKKDQDAIAMILTEMYEDPSDGDYSSNLRDDLEEVEKRTGVKIRDGKVFVDGSEVYGSLADKFIRSSYDWDEISRLADHVRDGRKRSTRGYVPPFMKNR